MVCVIADDITGAAEMAGIAHRFGLSVCLLLDGHILSDCDVAVIATDTRSMTKTEAVEETRRILLKLKDDCRIEVFFKKTDSALRGHVVEELSEMMDVLGIGKALYLPANPSKKRTISDGRYLIDGVPIDKTAFSFDPEFPAFSSRLKDRFPEADAHRIMFADILTAADLDTGVEKALSENLLLAGAADLFTSFVKRYFHAAEKEGGLVDVGGGSCIIVCGSTQSDPGRCGVVPSYMPTELYDGVTDAHAWESTLVAKYIPVPHRVLLAVKDHHRTGREVAVHIRQTMANAVARLVEILVPDNLVIEGGATAYSILRILGWDSFNILDEIAPGVISMQWTKGGCIVTMKPGSYPWGSLFIS